jgi:hypothetical protein
VPAAGLSPAAFTPLGGRLVTESLLVDGASGRFIAELPYETPRYLEGGPPRHAIHIGDTHAVSLERGVQMWELDRGTLVVSRDKPWYSSGDRVAIAPDGERYAVTRVHAGSPVSIVVTRTGASTDVNLPTGAMDWGTAGLGAGGPDDVERPPAAVVAHKAEGALVFELPGGARVWFPADGELVSLPTEPVFAGPGVHVRVKGVERRATG